MAKGDNGSSVPVTVVVLAAGRGERMNSAAPKALQSLAGRSVLSQFLDTAAALRPHSINVVFGHGGDAIRDAFAERDLVWTRQAEQLGTGHALAQALPWIPDEHQVLVLCGDVPLVSAASLARLVTGAGAGGVGLLTAQVNDPHGYGRVLRDGAEAVAAVVEEADATPRERAVNEINTGIMVLPAQAARRWLNRLDDGNTQGELYLTDVIAMAVSEAVPVAGRAGR